MAAKTGAGFMRLKVKMAGDTATEVACASAGLPGEAVPSVQSVGKAFKLSVAMLCLAFLALATSGVPSAVSAQSSATTSASAVLVIGNDEGGLVSRRAEEISRILSQGTHVEIRGQVCFSACTMYLGMPDTCVLPQTSFGFHGPSHYGRQLSARDFEYWSQVIAAHYPAPLRTWYLAEGRTRIWDYFTISGTELIRLGVRQCSARSGA
jgi:hypothetical protein